MATAQEEVFEFPDEKEAKAAEAAAATQANAEEDVEVEIVDDTPEKDKGRAPLAKKVDEPTDEELEQYSEGVKKRIGELTHARHDERRRAEALERQLAEAQRVAKQLLEERRQIAERYNSGQETFVTVAKEKAENELAAAKAELKAAHEAFDTDAIVEAQAKVASAQYRVEQAKNFRPTPLQVPEIELQTAQAQPEAPELDQKTLSWQARNQWFGRPGNEEHTSFALGLHQKLVAQGVDPRSDAYFAQIDARMKAVFPDLFEDAPKPKPGEGPSEKRPATVVAPASRSASPGKIRLNKSQVALAARLGLTPQQYARELAKTQEAQ